MKRESVAFPLAALAAGLALLLVLALSLHAPQRLVALIVPRHAPHRLDGRAVPGEYRYRWSDKASGLDLQWSIQGDRLVGAVSSPDTGWVAVGFGGSGPLMYGADIVIGYVDARGAHLHDHFADTPTSHVSDSALGGHDDVLAGAGLQSGAGTTIEFERPLAAHDSTDQPIESGQTHVMVASSQADDFMSYHVGGHKAVALLDLFNGPPAAAHESFLPDHITDVQIMLATWMTLLLLVAFHGLAADWAARSFAAPAPDATGGESAAVALIGVAVLVELAALAAFGAGVAMAAPTWFLGSSLTIGLLALAALLILYGRSFVRWGIIRGEREDGIPW